MRKKSAKQGRIEEANKEGLLPEEPDQSQTPDTVLNGHDAELENPQDPGADPSPGEDASASLVIAQKELNAELELKSRAEAYLAEIRSMTGQRGGLDLRPLSTANGQIASDGKAGIEDPLALADNQSGTAPTIATHQSSLNSGQPKADAMREALNSADRAAQDSDSSSPASGAEEIKKTNKPSPQKEATEGSKQPEGVPVHTESAKTNVLGSSHTVLSQTEVLLRDLWQRMSLITDELESVKQAAIQELESIRNLSGKAVEQSQAAEREALQSIQASTEQATSAAQEIESVRLAAREELENIRSLRREAQQQFETVPNEPDSDNEIQHESEPVDELTDELTDSHLDDVAPASEEPGGPVLELDENTTRYDIARFVVESFALWRKPSPLSQLAQVATGTLLSSAEDVFEVVPRGGVMPPFSNSLIMVVENEPQALALEKLVLEGQGFRIKSVSTGEEALASFPEDNPALVVLDIGLDGMDGFTTCQMVRNTSQIPIILVSGLDSPDDYARALEVGADDYLAKPFLTRELPNRVEALLNLALRRQNLGSSCHADLPQELYQGSVGVLAAVTGSMRRLVEFVEELRESSGLEVLTLRSSHRGVRVQVNLSQPIDLKNALMGMQAVQRMTAPEELGAIPDDQVVGLYLFP